MATTPTNANGHRRRQILRRVRAEEHDCYLCDQPVDKTLSMVPGAHGPKCNNIDCEGCVPHPMRGEVDEVTPRARGGSPLRRSNTRLSHRTCNRIKGTRTVEQARAIIIGRPETELVVTSLLDW